MLESRSFVLPSGRILDLQRPRSAGVLDREELEYCRHNQLPLGYDALQGGWVSLLCEDDLFDTFAIPDDRTVATSEPEHTLERLRQRLREQAQSATEQLSAAAVPVETAARVLRAFAESLAEELASSFDLVTVDRCRTALRCDTAAALASLGMSRAERRAATSLALSFRKWRLDDVGSYARLLGNPNVWRYMSDACPLPFTEQMARELIELSWVEARHEVLAVEIDGVPVGQCRLRFDEPFAGVRAAEAAYWLGEEHWGRGLMSAVLPAYTLRSFERHGLDLVYLWIIAENRGSIRVAERAGYRRDDWQHEDELARALKKSGVVRYVCHRTEYASGSNSIA